MSCCDKKKCPIVYHTDCLRIATIPKGKLYCPDCRKEIAKKAKRKT